MNKYVHEVVRDIKLAHPDWIQHFSFWKFDDKDVKMTVRSPHADALIYELEELAKDTKNAPYVCKDLLVLEVLIQALTDNEATKNDIVYLYVQGGMKLNKDKLTQLFDLIDTLGAKIHITIPPRNNCGFDLDSEELTTLARIAEYSGGAYYITTRGETIRSLPLQYESSIIYDEFRKGCDQEQTFYFPIAAEAQTISVLVTGEQIKNYPTFIAPGHVPVSDVPIYKYVASSLSVIYKGKGLTEH